MTVLNKENKVLLNPTSQLAFNKNFQMKWTSSLRKCSVFLKSEVSSLFISNSKRNFILSSYFRNKKGELNCVYLTCLNNLYSLLDTRFDCANHPSVRTMRSH